MSNEVSVMFKQKFNNFRKDYTDKEKYKSIPFRGINKISSRSSIVRLLLFILGLTVILLLIYYAGLNNVLDKLEHANPLFIALSIGAYASSWIFRTERLKELVKNTCKKISFWTLFKIYISGYALNVLLPAKLGDVATIGYLNMNKIGIGKSTAIVIQTRILDVIALIIISVLSMWFVCAGPQPGWIISSVIFSMIIVSIPIGIVTLDREKKAISTINYAIWFVKKDFSKNMITKIADAYDEYHNIISDRKMFFYTIILSLFIWLIDGITCFMVSLSLNTSISIALCIFAVMIANIGKSFPSTPGSIGIYEVVLASVLTIFGIPYSYAILIAVIDHLIKNLFTLAIGLPLTLTIGMNILSKSADD